MIRDIKVFLFLTVGNSLLGIEETMELNPYAYAHFFISDKCRISIINSSNKCIALVNYTFPLVKEVMELK
jgi:hypothetical protein